MVEKGNRIENWNDQYRTLATTYTEKAVTPAQLVNYIGQQFIFEDIIKYLPNSSNIRTLEIGCGGARTSVYLALRNINATCADFAPEAVRLAADNFKSAGAKGTVIQDDFMNSELPSESFDCVMSFGLLEHFKELEPMIKAIDKLVKPGGIQIHAIIPKKFSTQVIMNFVSFPFEFMKRFLKGNFKGIFSKSYRDFPHFENKFTDKEYCTAFEKEGYSILRNEAAGTLYSLINLPLNTGNLLVKYFPKLLANLIRMTDRTELEIMHSISPVIYIVCRKKS